MTSYYVNSCDLWPKKFIADTNVMHMSANCYVPVEGLTSSVFPTSQMWIKNFLKGSAHETGVNNF